MAFINNDIKGRKLQLKIYHTVYKTTNLINGKIYIGIHSSSDQYDSYLGSGLILKHAIKKYGKHNFKKEVLLCALAQEYLYEFEKSFIQMICNNENSYNISKGGHGGNTGNYSGHIGNAWASNVKWCEERKQKMRDKMLGNKYGLGLSQSDETKLKRSISSKGHKKPKSWVESRKTRTGKLSSNVKLHIVISPQGEVYEVYGLEKFCKDHNLSLSKMRDARNKGPIPQLSKAVKVVFETSLNTVGWEIKSGE